MKDLYGVKYNIPRATQIQSLSLVCTYRILHELSFDINFYETSLENVIKLYN